MKKAGNGESGMGSRKSVVARFGTVPIDGRSKPKPGPRFGVSMAIDSPFPIPDSLLP